MLLIELKSGKDQVMLGEVRLAILKRMVRDGLAHK